MTQFVLPANKHLYFTRHAESWGNVGKNTIDPPLTDKGILEAKKLVGHVDCIVVSPMRRCKETLQYSQFTYNTLIINYNFREKITALQDTLLLEKVTVETEEQFKARIKLFNQEILALFEQYDNILLIGHAYYLNLWYNDALPTKHATIIQLI